MGCANFFKVILMSLFLFFVYLFKIFLKNKKANRFAITNKMIDKRINIINAKYCQISTDKISLCPTPGMIS